MARGVLSGIGLGAAFSIGVAIVISIVVPIEPGRAPDVGDTAAGVEAADGLTLQADVRVTEGETQDVTAPQPSISLRAPVESPAPEEPPAAAQAPDIGTQAPETAETIAPDDTPVSQPARDPDSRVPEPEQPTETAALDEVPQPPAPLPQPKTGQAGDLTTPRPLPDSVAALLQQDEPVLPNPQALAPMIPDDAPDAPDVQRVPVPAATPEAAPVEDTADAAESEVVSQPDPAVSPQTAPADSGIAPDESEQAQGEPAQTEPAQTEQEEAAVVVRPRVLPAPGTEGASTTNRPRIGTPASTLIDRTDAETDAPTETLTIEPLVDPAQQAPIRRYGVAFKNPDAKPLMSILLIDTGVDLDAGGIGLPALSSFPYPVSFAIDSSLPDARERMDRYRAEGFEVLAMVDLPQGAQPSDAEVSLAVALNTLPEVVGILDGTGAGLQGSRAVADQVTAIIKSAGLGLVAQSKGLDSMPKLAVKEGVPAAPVFRDFDSKDQNARVIRRFLDQAAFKAAQEGSVILQGRLRPETIEALLVWGLADRASTVSLAPISAVLLAQQ